MVLQEVDAPAWLHRYIIGRKGVNVAKLTEELPKVHISFTAGSDKITIEGPPEEVEQAEKALLEHTRDLMSRMAFADIEVDQKYHRHIIGRQGANSEFVETDNTWIWMLLCRAGYFEYLVVTLESRNETFYV